MMETRLERAKRVVSENINDAECGIFNRRNWVGDPMSTIYTDSEITVDICYHWGYFEVFGLTKEEFTKLEEYYNQLRGW